MNSDQHYLYSKCCLIFRTDPIQVFSHDLRCFGDAKFRGIYGNLLLKNEELIFVPDGNFSVLHLSKKQILRYNIRRKGSALRISILYQMFLLSDFASRAVRNYCFYIREGKKEDWQL